MIPSIDIIKQPFMNWCIGCHNNDGNGFDSNICRNCCNGNEFTRNILKTLDEGIEKRHHTGVNLITQEEGNVMVDFMTVPINKPFCFKPCYVMPYAESKIWYNKK